MKLGNKVLLVFIFLFVSSNILKGNEKIITSPLINIDEIKPSFEEKIDKNEDNVNTKLLKEKKKL